MAPKLRCVSLYTRFWVSSNSETIIITQNDPKMTLNKIQNQMYSIQVLLMLLLSPKYHSTLLYGQPSLMFELMTILRHGHRITPEWPPTPQGQGYHMLCVISVPESQISVRLALEPVVSDLWDIYYFCHWANLNFNHRRLMLKFKSLITICSNKILQSGSSV